jgi:hypothetical protein
VPMTHIRTLAGSSELPNCRRSFILLPPNRSGLVWNKVAFQLGDVKRPVLPIQTFLQNFYALR